MERINFISYIVTPLIYDLTSQILTVRDYLIIYHCSFVMGPFPLTDVNFSPMLKIFKLCNIQSAFFNLYITLYMVFWLLNVHLVIRKK